jgi:hypothetical protein
MIMTNNERENEMATLEHGDILWNKGNVDVVYWHETDNFEVWVRGEADCRCECNKSSEALEAAQTISICEG